VTEISKSCYLSCGKFPVQTLIRVPIGAYGGGGPYHSGSVESTLLTIKGIKVVYPSNAADMKGLLKSAFLDPNPVVMLEHKGLYGERGEVITGEAGIIPIGQARKVTEGSDVTIVAIGSTVLTAKAALDSQTEWSAEIIDLQTLIPWDKSSVMKSVAKTGRLVVVEESSYSGGWGAEICSEVVSKLWGQLKSPPHRITSPDAPIPYAQELEKRYLPSSEYVVAQVNELLKTGKSPAAWWEGAK
jgi:pyruvate/2-oxoglutarate/acetoin dehydrogenase E1 component